MTFNMWHTGESVEDGQNKVAKHIKRVNPDVVAMQEAHNDNTFQMVMDILGGGWAVVRLHWIFCACQIDKNQCPNCHTTPNDDTF